MLASLVFYGQLGLEYLVLRLVVALLNWGSMQLLRLCGGESTRRWLVAGDVALHVCLLAFYKYAEPIFLLLSEIPGWALHQWLMASGMGDVVLPAGLSFYSFMGLSLVVDHYRDRSLPQNFEAPYRSLNLQEFWRRWHITLSLWLRDYLYIPMGGSRRGNRYVNLTVTMVIGGLWRGSGLNFLIWGFFHGLGLAVVHAFHSMRGRLGLFPQSCGRWWSLAEKVLAWFLTFHFVAALWVFFRARSFDEACGVFRRVVCGGEGSGADPCILLIIALVLFLQWAGSGCSARFSALMARLPWGLQALAAGLLGGAASHGG